MIFKVTKIFNGDTFEISPALKRIDRDESIVRAMGYNAPNNGENGFEEAKNKLYALVFGKEVKIDYPIEYFFGRLLCEVYFNGKNLADYFPEYLFGKSINNLLSTKF
jgi:hypothetical protein